MHKGRKFHVGYEFMYRKPVHMAEEELAELALATGSTHLLLMDDDIYDVTAEDFFNLIDADVDVVGGIMHASGFPYSMCAFRRYNTKVPVANMPITKGPSRLYEVPPEQREGLQKVDLIPFAFTLIKTDVLRKIKQPWFFCNKQAPTDSWFADSVLGKGFQYYAHFGVWLNHRGITRENRALQYQMGLQKAQKKGNNQIVALTHDEMRRHEVFMGQKLEEAEAKVKAGKSGKIKFEVKK